MSVDGGEGPTYYVISDLHIGGDEQLEHVEFLKELLSFLERLEETDENAELIVNGGARGTRPGRGLVDARPAGHAFLGRFGTAGTALWCFLTVNVAEPLLLVGIPLYFIRRDLRQTIDRFEVFETDLTVDPNEPYKDAAREMFEERPETAVFCYGHTHRPTITEVEGGWS